jgi:mono/diheme cytochrome c family protein
LIAITCFMCTCLVKKEQEDKSFQQRPTPREFVVNVDSLIKAARPDEMIEVLISYDPNVPVPKTYQGIKLGEQLTRVLKQHHLVAERFDIVLMCKDGYAPVRHATELLGVQDGYIVFKDRATPPGKNWSPEMEKIFSPFYLVWKTDREAAGELPWPYGLISIKLIERDSLLLTGLSKGAGVLNGYHLFRKHCFSCHSINKNGGQVGPEMNWPRNITEYWTEENIRHYIKDPKSFRYNAHMPAMKQIDDTDIDALLQYLHYMKRHKSRK